jgi:eukaryotic-like serine/threonine-protein kinase
VKPVTVGSFQLAEPLARGGMGSVWRAVHRSGVAAAVKIIPAPDGDAARAAGALDAAATLQAEIRSVGALDHPNIIRVFDAGTLEAEQERASGGQLRAGSPWLAMELCDGSVYDLYRDFDWPQLSDLLLQVLDALAHAHARGVVHRDLKPANLLYVRSHSVRILLADFGLAWRRGGDLVHGGSLPYAAPEQILGVRTEQGPWTDLYGLGCCAYRLATGQRPYRGADPEQVKRGHLFAPIPKPSARFAVPRGFAGWLAGLMAKDPGERFQSAADAAFALLQLAPAETPARRGGAVEDDDTTGTLGSSRLGTDGTATLPVTHWARREREGGGRAASRVRPPVPADWAPPAQDRPSPLGGRGLGLFGLRVPPIAGRTAERDRLWQILLGLDRPAIAVLRGGAGTGKSRLASWLVERAVEVGAAEGFRARFGPDDGEGDGLAEMVEEHLNTHGLPAEEIVRHLRHRVSPEDLGSADRAAYALARLLRPDDPLIHDDPLQSAERVGVAWQVLRRRASRRLIVWLDDVQHDVEALDLADHALGDGEVPVLFLVTVRDEPPPVRERLRALVDRLQGVEFDLEPLSVREIETLVKRMLPAEGDLAARIAENAGGSPLVAVQLVAGLIERGALSGDPTGVRLASNEQLPASLTDFWTGALERLEVPGARDALRIAAVLGGTFVHSQWRDVAQRLERPIAPKVPTALVNRGFVMPERTGRYTFAHPLLREILAAEARSDGPSVDQACAAALVSRGPAFAGRAAAHLEVAGDAAGAAEGYLAAVRWLAEWDRRRAMEVSERWHAALSRVAGDRDPRWAPGLAVRIDLLSASGGPAHAAAVQELLARARAMRDAPAEIRGLIELAWIDLRALALDRAEARAELAAHRSRGTALQGRAAVARAEVRRLRGDLRTAEAALREQQLADGGDAAVVLALCRVRRDAGRAAEALALLDEWAGQLPRAESPVSRARLLRVRGQLLGVAGQLTEAVATLEDADRMRARASWDWPMLDLDRGCALAAHGDLARAEVVLEPLLERIDPRADARLRAHLLAGLAEIAAAAGRWDASTELVKGLEALPTRGHRAETLTVMHRVAQLARGSSEHGLAHRARRWADRAAASGPPLDARRAAE